jgi:two-component system cell cycle sensor histidine kinase/response regulator CckA
VNADDSNLELENLYRTAPVGLGLVDAAQCYLRVNDTLAAMNGAMAEAHIGRSVQEMVPVIAVTATSLIQRVIDTGEPVIAEPHRGTTGGTGPEARDWYASYYPLAGPDGAVWAVSIVVQDVGELRRAESEAYSWRNRYEAAVLASGQLLYDWDSETDEVAYGGSLDLLLGYTQAEMAGGLAHWRSLIHPDDRARFDDVIAQLIATREHAHLEYRVRHKDGSYVHVEDRGGFFADEQGKPIRMIGFVVDQTKRRAQEVALRTSEERLLRAQKLEVVGRLAGGIAHDFNNLLTVIISATAMAAESAGEGTRSELAEVTSAAKRAADLTRQLLTFARRQPTSSKILELNDVLVGMIKMMRRVISEDIELVTVLTDASCSVEVDQSQLEQVMINLAINARDAMPDGGTLTLRTANVVLKEPTPTHGVDLPPGRYAQLEVSDSGLGMSEEVLEHIFEPFFTTKPLGEGSGMGLATSYGIIKQAGGEVIVRSGPGEGTAFYIYLPAAEGEATSVETHKDAEESARGMECILVVEDEAMVLELTERILTSHGYTVHSANTGSEALRIASAEGDAIDLVLSDVIMPDMSGFELADELRRVLPGLRVLFMSGYTDKGVIDAPFVAKPFTPAQLTSRVRSVIDSTT